MLYFSKAAAKVLLFFDMSKFFCVFLQKSANLAYIELTSAYKFTQN